MKYDQYNTAEYIAKILIADKFGQLKERQKNKEILEKSNKAYVEVRSLFLSVDEFNINEGAEALRKAKLELSKYD